jgi:hypothetical protein
VDFLVLIHSHAFVGLGSSTFSVYTREHRVMTGYRWALGAQPGCAHQLPGGCSAPQRARPPKPAPALPRT